MLYNNKACTSIGNIVPAYYNVIALLAIAVSKFWPSTANFLDKG